MTEPVEGILKRHDIAPYVRQQRNLIQMLEHPKDKVEDKHKTEYVYQIQCNTCNMCYIGETGSTFGSRLSLHKNDVETVTTRRFIRETRKCSTNVEHKSAITDHADKHNWEGAKLVDKETNRCTR